MSETDGARVPRAPEVDTAGILPPRYRSAWCSRPFGEPMCIIPTVSEGGDSVIGVRGVHAPRGANVHHPYRFQPRPFLPGATGGVPNNTVSLGRYLVQRPPYSGSPALR